MLHLDFIVSFRESLQVACVCYLGWRSKYSLYKHEGCCIYACIYPIFGIVTPAQRWSVCLQSLVNLRLKNSGNIRFSGEETDREKCWLHKRRRFSCGTRVGPVMGARPEEVEGRRRLSKAHELHNWTQGWVGQRGWTARLTTWIRTGLLTGAEMLEYRSVSPFTSRYRRQMVKFVVGMEIP